MARTNLTAGNSIATGTIYATAILNPTANRLVLAFVLNARSSTLSAATPSLTGNGLTWERIETVTTGLNGDRRLTCFRAMGATPSAGALTISFGPETQDLCAWSVFEYDGVDSSGANGAGAIAQSRSQTGTGTSLAVVLNPFADPVNNLAVGGIILDLLVDPVRPVDPGAGFVEIHEQSPNRPGGKGGTLQTQDRAGQKAHTDPSLLLFGLSRSRTHAFKSFKGGCWGANIERSTSKGKGSGLKPVP